MAHELWGIALPKSIHEKRLQAPGDESTKTLCNRGSIRPFAVREEQRGSGLLFSRQATPDAGPCLNETFASDGFPSTKKDLIRKSAPFLASLRTCTTSNDLHRGSKIHSTISTMGLLAECSDSLVIMYAKCGALAKAQELLDMHDSRDVFSWTALIAGYARQGKSQDALVCFEQMKQKGLSPDAVTFACVLKACGKLGAVDKGKQIHDEIMRQGMLGKHVVLGTALVHMYTKCGALAKAQRVLEELLHRNVITWGVLIAGYVQYGQAEQALKCFECMQGEGIAPNAMTFTCILKACATLQASDKGEVFHDKISRQGLLRGNVVLGNALVDMYAKCGAIKKAKGVLEELSPRNTITWITLIAGYAEQGQGEQALTCFERMQGKGFSADAVTYASILKACSSLGAIDIGEQIHDRISKLTSVNSELMSSIKMHEGEGKLLVMENEKKDEQIAFLSRLSAELEVSHSAMQGEMAKQKATSKALASDNAILQSSIETKTKAILALQKQVDNFAKGTVALESQIEAMSSMHSLLEVRVKNLQEESIAQSAALTAQKHGSFYLQSTLGERNIKIKSLEVQLAEANTAATHLQDQVNENLDCLMLEKNKEIGNLKAQFDEAYQNKTDLITKLKTCNGKKSMLEAQFKNIEAELATTKGEVLKAKKELIAAAKWEGEFNEASKRVSLLEAQLTN